MSGKTLALTMAAEQVVIAAVYLCARDYRHAAYWFFGACLIVSVTI